MPIFEIVLRMPFFTAVMYWSVNWSMADVLRQIAVGVQLLDGLEGQVGIDGVGPVAAEQAEVHHFAGLAAFDDDAGLAAQPPSQQAVVQGGGGQQAGDRRPLGRDVAVAEDQQRRPVGDRPLGRVDQLVQRLAQAPGRIGTCRPETGPAA